MLGVVYGFSIFSVPVAAIYQLGGSRKIQGFAVLLVFAGFFNLKTIVKVETIPTQCAQFSMSER